MPRKLMLLAAVGATVGALFAGNAAAEPLDQDTTADAPALVAPDDVGAVTPPVVHTNVGWTS